MLSIYSTLLDILNKIIEENQLKIEFKKEFNWKGWIFNIVYFEFIIITLY